MEVQLNQESPRCQHHDEFWRGVTCVAQFLDTQEASLPNSRYLSRQSIQSQYRTRLEKFKTLLEGKTIAVRSQHHSSENVTKLIDLEFNSQRQAWHYGTYPCLCLSQNTFFHLLIKGGTLTSTRRTPSTV